MGPAMQRGSEPAAHFDGVDTSTDVFNSYFTGLNFSRSTSGVSEIFFYQNLI